MNHNIEKYILGYSFRKIGIYDFHSGIMNPQGFFLPDRLRGFLVRPDCPIIFSVDSTIMQVPTPPGDPLGYWSREDKEKGVYGYSPTEEFWYDYDAMNDYFKDISGESFLFIQEEPSGGWDALEIAKRNIYNLRKNALGNLEAQKIPGTTSNTAMQIDAEPVLKREEEPTTKKSILLYINTQTFKIRFNNIKDWQLIGYDVVEFDSRISGLTNCGYNPKEEDYKQRNDLLLGKINEFHLISTLDVANQFASFSDINVPDHAPFVVVSMYVKKERYEELQKLVRQKVLCDVAITIRST